MYVYAYIIAVWAFFFFSIFGVVFDLFFLKPQTYKHILKLNIFEDFALHLIKMHVLNPLTMPVINQNKVCVIYLINCGNSNFILIPMHGFVFCIMSFGFYFSIRLIKLTR